MRKLIPALLFIVLALGQYGCNKSHLQREAGATEEKGKRNLQVPPSLSGLDETVDTQWVDEIPEQNGLVTISGQIGITGSEPSVKVVIYEKENVFFALSGNEEFMNFITGYQNQHITVSGVVVKKDGIQWLKVWYVLKK